MIKFRRIKIIAVVSILVCICAVFASLFNNNYAHASTSTYELTLNERKHVTLSGVNVETFNFTPTTNQYYVVETTGSVDTVMRVNNLSCGSIVNDDGGIDNNSRIYFKGEPSRPIKIELKIVEDYSSNEVQTGSVMIQVRKQQFSMFSYLDDEKNNFCVDLTKPYNCFSDKFECVKYENEIWATYLYEDVTRFLPPINSEIMFFSGHGDTSGVYIYVNGVMPNVLNKISVNQGISLDRVKISLWAACESSNIAEASVMDWRAKSSVGFKKTIQISSSSKFSDKFFEKLAGGATVNEAAKAGAKTAIWAWDNVKKYVVFGNGDIRATDITPNDVTFSLRPVNDEELALIGSEISSGYTEEYLGDNEYRYYEMINGYESNNIIDVKRENGKIIGYEDMRSEYNTVLDINEAYLCVGLNEYITGDDGKYRLLREQEEHIVYYNFDGIMTPVKISIATYCNEYGISISEADCINLFNGQKLDYSEISGL